MKAQLAVKPRATFSPGVPAGLRPILAKLQKSLNLSQESIEDSDIVDTVATLTDRLIQLKPANNDDYHLKLSILEEKEKRLELQERLNKSHYD